MESNYWILIVALNFLFATDVSGVKKSKLEAKVDALDFIVRGELYLLKETIETDRLERKELVKKLNQTLELLELSTGDRTDKTQVDTNNHGVQQELHVLSEKMEQNNKLMSEKMEQNNKLISEKMEQNNKAINQLAESQIRTKRGFMEEKKARKADATAVVTKHIQMQKTLNDLTKTQQEIIKNQNEIIKNQNKLVNNVTDMLNEIITNQDDNMNVIATKTVALQNTMVDMRKKLDMFEQTLKNELSKSTKMTNNTTRELVLKVSHIDQAVEEVKEAVAPKLYCNNQMDLDACLNKHFADTVQKVQKLWPVRLVGGTNQYEGRVEVFYQERRGTVCDDGWDNYDARVVCREMGFTGGTAFQGPAASHGHSFGEGTGDILLDDVACTGDELSLFACDHRGIGVEDCTHREDAGVRCDP